MSDTYLIPATNMDRLVEEIEKMNRKATKLKCQPVVLHVGERIVNTKKDKNLDIEYETVSFECTITGDTPMLSGWQMIAAIEPVDNGEMIVREVPGQTCPVQFRTTGLMCDHCGKQRRRNAVFVLRNEHDVYKQVGRNCLSDFLGGISPEELLSTSQFVLSFAALCGEAENDTWGRGSRAPILVPLERFVAITSIVIRKLGWTSKSEAAEGCRSTASVVWDICAHQDDKYVQQLIREFGLVAEPRDVESAHAAIEWGRQFTSDNAPNSYLHDLGVCCRQETVSYKTSGYVASLLNAHGRHLSSELNDKQRKEKKVGGYVGTPGQRMDFENLKVLVMAPYTSGIYQKTLVKFVDPNGNALIWRASGQPDWLEIGKTFNVAATVCDDGHKPYNGELQTSIQRVKLHEMVEV